MNNFLFFVVINFVSSAEGEIPPTKNIFGGVFNWVNALAYQRKLWEKSTVLPWFTFYAGDPDLKPVANHFVTNNVNMNLTAELGKIKDIFTSSSSSSFSSIESSSVTTTATSNTIFTRSLFQKMEFAKVFQALSSYYYNNNNKLQSTNGVLLNDGEYKNVNLLKLDPAVLGLTEKDCDIILGQVFTCIGVITILVVIFVISFLFFTGYLFVCCCCCKPRTRDSPSCFSIIVFVISIWLMVIGCIMEFIPVLNIHNMWNFAVNDFAPTTNGIIDSLNNSINKIYEPVKEKLGQPVNKLIDDVNVLSDNIVNSGEKLVDNATTAVDMLQNGAYKVYMNDVLPNIKSSLAIVAALNKKIDENPSQCAGFPKGDEIMPDEGITNAEKYIDFIESIQGSINSVKDLVKFPKDTMAQITDMLNKFLPYINDMKNQVNLDSQVVDLKSQMNKLGEQLSSYKKVNVLSFDLNVDLAVKILTIIPGIIMVIITVAFAFTFFTHCCCSRCIAASAWCEPWFCSILLVAIGAATSLVAFLAVFLMSNIVDLGDYSINSVIDKVLVDRTIQVPDIDLSDITEGMIGVVTFDPIKIKEGIEIIQHFLEAKEDESIVTALSLRNWLPIPEFGNVLNNTFSKMAESYNISVFVKFVEDMKIQITENIPESLDKLFKDDYNITEEIDKVRKNIEKLSNASQLFASTGYSACVATEDDINKLTTYINEIDNGFQRVVPLFDEAANMVKVDVINSVNNMITVFNNSLTTLLKTTGGTVKILFENVYGVLDNFEATPLFGILNVFRTTILYNATVFCVYWSIGAHLFLVGMFIMVINIIIRRRGMLSEASSTGASSSYSSTASSSSASSSSLAKRKKSNNNDPWQEQPKSNRRKSRSSNRRRRSTEYSDGSASDNNYTGRAEDYVF